MIRIQNAHRTNIKVVRTLDDSTRLISTSSDGVINVWDLNCRHDQTTGALQLPKKLDLGPGILPYGVSKERALISCILVTLRAML